MAYVFFAVAQAMFVLSGVHESYQRAKKLRSLKVFDRYDVK